MSEKFLIQTKKDDGIIRVEVVDHFFDASGETLEERDVIKAIEKKQIPFVATVKAETIEQARKIDNVLFFDRRLLPGSYRHGRRPEGAPPLHF
jgi:hypothetical protein